MGNNLNADDIKKSGDPSAVALKTALQDIEQDEDLNVTPEPTDDLDESELAKFDNSNEKAFDALENTDLIKNINNTPDVNNTR